MDVVSLYILLILFVLYLFAIMPRINNGADRMPFMNVHYAHRGFHDNQTEAPENSMAAFRKAVDAEYGIELDVQLTKDRIPVVFHDETLRRVCKVGGKVRDYTYEELQEFRLCNSEEKIPLFADVLKVVDGKVPLIVEIKIHENATEVCTAVDAVLGEYQGIYCMESFHPFAVYWYRKNRPEVLRGQLSSNFNKTGKNEPFAQWLVHYLLLNCLGRPDFIAYNHKFKYNISRLICKYVFRALSVAYTIKTQEELDKCKKDFDLFIFEGFEPVKEEQPVEEPAMEVAALDVEVAEEPTEESATEEVPAEESATEEVPAEEPATEEVPAEEPITEEVPAEEPTTEAALAEENKKEC